MTDDDKITISREQFKAWVKHKNFTLTEFGKFDGIPTDPFDSIKAFVTKPARRRYQVGDHGPEYWVIQQFPNDIGPMTRDEAREWVKNAWATYGQEALTLPQILKALGLGDE